MFRSQDLILALGGGFSLTGVAKVGRNFLLGGFLGMFAFRSVWSGLTEAELLTEKLGGRSWKGAGNGPFGS